jgi:hypothetical protein
LGEEGAVDEERVSEAASMETRAWPMAASTMLAVRPRQVIWEAGGC